MQLIDLHAIHLIKPSQSKRLQFLEVALALYAKVKDDIRQSLASDQHAHVIMRADRNEGPRESRPCICTDYRSYVAK